MDVAEKLSIRLAKPYVLVRTPTLMGATTDGDGSRWSHLSIMTVMAKRDHTSDSEMLIDTKQDGT